MLNLTRHLDSADPTGQVRPSARQGQPRDKTRGTPFTHSPHFDSLTLLKSERKALAERRKPMDRLVQNSLAVRPSVGEGPVKPYSLFTSRSDLRLETLRKSPRS
jgi:hypothetical protein